MEWTAKARVQTDLRGQVSRTGLIYTTHPYLHQSEALEVAFDKPNFAYFLEQGTGKSKIVVDEIVNLIERKKITLAVIVAPNLVHINWVEQFETHGPPNYKKWEIQVFKSGVPLVTQEAETRRIINSGKVLVFLINVEAFSYQKAPDYLLRLLRSRHQSYICIDESHKIKSPGARRTKQLVSLGRMAMYRRIATGTEAAEGIEDIFSQFNFLRRGLCGHNTMASFKAMHCIMGGFESRQILGYRYQQILADTIAPFIYAKRKHECLDLPDKVYVTHHIEMTGEQKVLYDRLRDDLMLLFEDEATIDATLAITRIMRLQQILCGHLTVEKDGHDEHRLVKSTRANFVAELVDEHYGKSIVFTRFVRDVELVKNALDGLGIMCIPITGSISPGSRMELINMWRKQREYRALVMTIATGGTGLTLNEANNVIYYSNDWSSTNRIQSEDRCHRIGQTSKVTYHDIVVKKSVDEVILRALKNKVDAATYFRELITSGKRNFREGIGFTP
jgi:SNF2 family DNA or RNA helicase